MSLNQKIQPYVLALGLGAALNGCAAATPDPQVEKAIDESKKVDKNSPEMIAFKDGYTASAFESLPLTILAGIYAGQVRVRKTEEGYRPEVNWFDFIYFADEEMEKARSEAMSRVLKEADTNRDKIITRGETKKLEERVYEKYAE